MYLKSLIFQLIGIQNVISPPKLRANQTSTLRSKPTLLHHQKQQPNMFLEFDPQQTQNAWRLRESSENWQTFFI